MSPIQGAVAAINAAKPSAIGSYFTPDAVVVDNVAPFRWMGPNAAMQWLVALMAYAKFARISNITGTIGHPGQIVVDHDRAYAVVPIRISTTRAGRHHESMGLWALTLVESGGNWKIASAAWAEKP